jgi:hypothetical protein
MRAKRKFYHDLILGMSNVLIVFFVVVMHQSKWLIGGGGLKTPLRDGPQQIIK